MKTKRRRTKHVRVTKDQWIKWKEQAETAAYERGLKKGSEEARKELDAELQRESLKARIKLAEAYASVFESIARSAHMYFDGGANLFR